MASPLFPACHQILKGQTMAINQYNTPADFIQGTRDLRWADSEHISMPNVTIKNPDDTVIPLKTITLEYANLHDTSLSINDAALFFSDLSGAQIVGLTKPNIQYTCVSGADFSQVVVTPADVNFWYCQQGQAPQINNPLALAKVIVLSEEEFATFPQLSSESKDCNPLFYILTDRGSR
jgi:uncharacterized protein YjbI with pentapeptide repeats